jgi:hypothetical protein
LASPSVTSVRLLGGLRIATAPPKSGDRRGPAEDADPTASAAEPEGADVRADADIDGIR